MRLTTALRIRQHTAQLGPQPVPEAAAGYKSPAGPFAWLSLYFYHVKPLNGCRCFKSDMTVHKTIQPWSTFSKAWTIDFPELNSDLPCRHESDTTDLYRIFDLDTTHRLAGWGQDCKENPGLGQAVVYLRSI